MAGRGRLLKRWRGVEGVVLRALLRLKVLLPGGGRGCSRPALFEQFIQMGPPQVDEALKNTCHGLPLLSDCLSLLRDLVKYRQLWADGMALVCIVADRVGL